MMISRIKNRQVELRHHVARRTFFSVLSNLTLNLGFAFQYEDDLLDDDSPVSREETERRVRDYTTRAVAALEGLPGPVEFLANLAKRLVSRKN